MSTIKSVASLAVAATSCLNVACERIDHPGQAAGGTPMDFAELTDAVPLEYGRLVTVTPRHEHTAVLWFEKPDQSVVAVRVNISRGGISRAAVTFPRR